MLERGKRGIGEQATTSAARMIRPDVHEKFRRLVERAIVKADREPAAELRRSGSIEGWPKVQYFHWR